ncbi:DUF485 domain-containing protein [Streptomyces sp. DG2A-72]|uniref:DUF485 domain-containing protein n=1 Tax=Streptomyces sp. DG2A-72 TaxID=3051386 RepID=UPI00265BAE03|nr:DUF485 domain-containing protein [Streptomyces sp. DG2A-72]MDO0932588.1 DUF485 domain-containing protein [Streptomyces sp. DG2A-72]
MSLHPPPNDSFYPPPPPNVEPVSPESIHNSPEFHSMRSAHRSFGTAATLVSVGGFLTYVLLSSFAAGLMNQSLIGHLTIGLALGLGQFLLMGTTIWLYVRHMDRRIDPVTHRLRAHIRAQAQRPAPSARRSGTW